MAKKKSATSKATGKAAIKPVNKRLITVRIVGKSPLVCNNWSNKAKEMIRQKQQTGKKTRNRDLRDPQREAHDATYWMDPPECSIPGMRADAVKKSVLSAAHNDLGIPKTLVSKALFVYPPGEAPLVVLERADGKKSGKLFIAPEHEIVEDIVRVGQGSTDLRYRPYFYDWAITTTWEVDVDMLQVSDFLTLLDRAGFGVGIGERRPENGGEYGRYCVDIKFKVTDQPL